MSNYIGTYSGKKVYLPEPDPESFDIYDISRALSYAARFAGHTNQHWSVAKHCIAVSDLVPKAYKLQALLHDATEAYLCDMPTPFKLMMPEYRTFEDALWKGIAIRFDVDPELHPLVKEADKIMLMTERDELRDNGENWGEYYEDTMRVPAVFYEYNKYPMTETMDLYVKRFKEYGGRI